MLIRSRSSVIPARAAKALPAVCFKSFDQRPANYYRDVIATEEESRTSEVAPQPSTQQIQEAVERERERLSAEMARRAEEEFARGLAEGKAATERDLLRAIQLFQQYAQVLQAEKEELTQRYEMESIELAFELAGRVIGSELETNPEAVRSLARTALRQVLDCERIRLRVNPRDLQHMNALKLETDTLGFHQAKIEFTPDESVEAGGCVVETERGLLDATPSAQLATLRAGLRELGQDSK